MDMGTFDPHALILYASEVFVCQMICVYIVDIETFDLHALILYVSEGFL